MKISQLLIQPIGTKINPGMLDIKTYKKTWQVDSTYWSQVILMDETGEMPADFNVGKTFNPLRGRCGGKVNIIVAEVQEAEYLGKDRKKLVVDQYTIPSITMAEYDGKLDEIDKEGKLIVRSKVKCWIVSANSPKVDISKETTPDRVLEWLVAFVEDERLDRIVDGIIN